MKRIFTCLLLLVLANAARAQLRVALIGGPQSTSITEENTIAGWQTDISPYFSNRTGANVGLLGEVPLGGSTRWFLHPGLLYQTKGRKFFKRYDTSVAYLTDTLTLSKSFFNTYIEIPLNLAYKIPLGKKARFFLSAGPYVSFFYNGKESQQARLYSDNGFKKDIACGVSNFFNDLFLYFWTATIHCLSLELGTFIEFVVQSVSIAIRDGAAVKFRRTGFIRTHICLVTDLVAIGIRHRTSLVFLRTRHRRTSV